MFVAARELSLTAMSWELLFIVGHGLPTFIAEHQLQGVGLSVVVAHGLTFPLACGIFSDQGSNPCLQHWQANSQPLDHEGSPEDQRPLY